MLRSRAFIVRLALFLLLLVTSSATLERIGFALSSSDAREGDASACERVLDTDRDATDIELAQPVLRTSPRELRATRPAAAERSTIARLTLVANLRPIRVFSPVPHPPVRSPLIRLLN